MSGWSCAGGFGWEAEPSLSTPGAAICRCVVKLRESYKSLTMSL